jgi:hypothetical protein
MKTQKCFTVAALCPLWLLLAGSVAGAENPDSLQSRATLEAEISSQATAALRSEISSAGPGLLVSKIEIAATIKNESDKDGTYFSLILFDITVDGSRDPRFMYGSIGLAKSIREARQIAYKEWWAMFLPTFVRALTLSSDHLTEDGLQIYSSIIMCRGASPFPLAENQGSDSLLIVRPYIPLVRKSPTPATDFLRDAHAILLFMAVEQTGETSGYCYFNGQELPLAADARSIGLPSTGSTYMLKQLFIFRGSKMVE